MKELHIAGCFVQHEDTILLLHRQPGEEDGNTWGLPAGKIETGETPLEGMIRELHEETGLQVTQADVKELGNHTFTFPEMNITFHAHQIKLKELFTPALQAREHQDYQWVPIRECFDREDLIWGLTDVLEIFNIT